MTMLLVYCNDNNILGGKLGSWGGGGELGILGRKLLPLKYPR